MESNVKRIEQSITTVIRNVRVFNTSRCCFEKKDVALRGHVFYLIEDRLDVSCPHEIDGKDRYMLPGLIDIHTHIESSMTYPQAFYDAAMRQGTTTCVVDPHEIANVFGLAGIESFLANAKHLDLFFGIPSSVPSTNSALETTGGQIGLAEVIALLDRPQIKCLGEVMNFVDMQKEDSQINQMIALCKQKRPDLLIEGHCPKLSGELLSYYLYCGVDADHTQQTPDSILEKTAKGMFLEIQEKSITKENIQTIVRYDLYDMVALVTDDTMAHQLVHGHLNRLITKAVDCGMPLEKAIYIATYTPARRMHLHDRGMIAPGRQADFILCYDPYTWRDLEVYKKAERYHGQSLKPAIFPSRFYHCLRVPHLTKNTFCLYAPGKKEVRSRVIRIFPDSTFTTSQLMTLPVKGQAVDYQSAGLSLLVVIERYGKSGRIAYGLVQGALRQKGALASTWAHDHHNLVVLGNDSDLMFQLAERLIQVGGGVGALSSSQIALAPLEVGGIITTRPLNELADDLRQVVVLMEALGYKHHNPLMSFATLSLPVSPEIKITDAGLIDVRTQRVLPLFVKEEQDDESNVN